MSWRFAANFVQLHKTENPALGKRQLALSGVPDLMELAAGRGEAEHFAAIILHKFLGEITVNISFHHVDTELT